MISERKAMAVEGTKKRLASSFLWRIENISYWEPGLYGCCIISPTFGFCDMGFQTSFPLFLYPMGMNEDDRNLCIHVLPGRKFYAPMELEWSLLDVSGSPIVTDRKYYEEKHLSYLSDICSFDDVFKMKKSSFLPNDILTVRLRIWKFKGDFAQVHYITAFTRFKAEENSIKCRIKGLSCFSLNQEVTTPLRFKLANIQEVLILKMALRGSSLDDSAFYFEILVEHRRGNYLTIKLSILDSKQKATPFVNEKHVFAGDIPKQIWVVPKSIPRKEILERKYEWLCGDDLTLLCEVNSVSLSIDDGIESSYSGPEILNSDISKSNDKITKKDVEGTKRTETNLKCVVFGASGRISRTSQLSTKETNATHHDTDTLAALQEDFLSLYTDHTLSDFELRCGEVSFPVHKMVLSARSPVFRAMFCGDMKEANSTFQDIPDVDVHSLGRMLTFLYGGIVDDLQWESAAKLYYAADKYQVSTLKHECSSVLRSSVTLSNVSEILELAHKHHDQDLIYFVQEFFARHYDEIVLSDEWDKFMKRNSSLAGLTMKDAYKKKLQMKAKCV